VLEPQVRCGVSAPRYRVTLRRCAPRLNEELSWYSAVGHRRRPVLPPARATPSWWTMRRRIRVFARFITCCSVAPGPYCVLRSCGVAKSQAFCISRTTRRLTDSARESRAPSVLGGSSSGSGGERAPVRRTSCRHAAAQEQQRASRAAGCRFEPGSCNPLCPRSGPKWISPRRFRRCCCLRISG
jgi:hypothetical protein